jgi:hypothetical protein
VNNIITTAAENVKTLSFTDDEAARFRESIYAAKDSDVIKTINGQRSNNGNFVLNLEDARPVVQYAQ